MVMPIWMQILTGAVMVTVVEITPVTMMDAVTGEITTLVIVITKAGAVVITTTVVGAVVLGAAQHHGVELLGERLLSKLLHQHQVNKLNKLI